MEMHELPISLWVNNCTQKKNGILYRVEEKFEIENRMFSGKITPDILSNDYKRAHEILNGERKNAYKFITRAFE